MTTPYIQNLRSALGDAANGVSDEELVTLVAKSTGRNPAEVADSYRVMPTSSGQWGSRFGGAIDSYQSNLYDVGRAATGALGLPAVSGWMDRQRSSNDAQAEIERARAQNQGAVMSYKDINGIGDAANYVGGLAVDSSPYVAEALIGGGIGGLAARGAVSTGVRAAARMGGAVAASYPSSVGDIMSNQREQAGTTNDAAAAAYGVPYAALNAFSPIERMAANRTLTRNAINLLDGASGIKGGLARTAGSVVKAGAEEGLNEAGQEVMNQSGRMAVDPNAGLFDAGARDRYLESFIGGAALGGAAGALGGWRRSEHFGQPVTANPNTPTDLLAPRPDFSLQSYDQSQGPMAPQGQVQEQAPAGQAETDPRQMGLFSGVHDNVSGQPVELTSDELNSNTLPFVAPQAAPQEELTTSLGAAPAGGQVAPNTYENGVDFPTPATGKRIAGLPGEQMGLFGGSEVSERSEPQAGQTDTNVGMSEANPNQRDMFAEKPTTAVQTDFPLSRIRRQMLGATKGKIDSWTVKLAKALSDTLADPAERTQLLDKAEEELMTFDGATSTFEKRERALNEAKSIAELHDQRMGDARVQEGVIQSELRGDKATKTVSDKAAEVAAANSVDIEKDKAAAASDKLHLESELESTDARVADAAAKQVDQTRYDIMSRVLDDPATRNPVARFHAELKRAGVTDTAVRGYEIARTERHQQAKEALTAPDVIPSSPNELDPYATNTTSDGRTSASGGLAQRGSERGGDNQRAGLGGDGRDATGGPDGGVRSDTGGAGRSYAENLSASGDRGSTAPVNPSTPEKVAAEVSRYFPAEKLANRVTVVASTADLPEDVRKTVGEAKGTARGVTIDNGHVYIVANNVEQGAARGVLLHELGVHGGMDASLVRRLTEQIQSWAKRSDKLGEMARQAMVDASASSSTDVSDEVVAYMVERLVNSGIDPTSIKPTSPMGQFLKLIVNAMRAAARRLGMNIDEFTPQDVIDFAYGAAGAALHGGESTRTGASFSEADYSLPDPKKMPTMARVWGDTLGGWRAHPGLLGWYTNRQLGEKFPMAKAIAEGIGRMSAKAKSLMAQSHAVDLAWSKLSDEKATALHKAMIESTMANMHIIDSDTGEPITVKYRDGKPVWGDARSQYLNGHIDPAADGNLAKFNKLQAQFKELDQDQIKVYLDAQRKLRADFDAQNALFKNNVARAYERGLARYMGDPRSNPAFNGKSVDELAHLNRTEQKALMARPEWQRLSKVARKDVQAMWHDVNTQADQSSQLRGPYFPLTRFGDHIVTVKSARYAAAQEQVKAIQEQLGMISTLDSDTPEQQELLEKSATAKRAELAAARKTVEDMRDNPKDYQVEFFEKRAEAMAREKFVREQWIPGAPERSSMTVERQLRSQYNSSLDSMSDGFVKKLEDQLTATLPPKEVTAVQNALRAIYLQQLPDRSALKALLKRQNVAGVKTGEMRRAFASATLRNAWRLSRMEHSNDIKTSIDDLRQSRDEDSRIVGDEFGKRFLTSIQMDEEKPFIDTLSNMGYIWHLAASPAYLITNLSQPWTTSLPMMVARAGGLGAAAKHLTTATQQVVGNMIEAAKTDGARFEVNLDGDKFTDGERAMLKNLLNQGLIDVTLEHDLGNVAAGKEETLGGKIMRYAAWPAHQTEVVNRVATALAAYRVALDKPGTSQAEAMTYAEDIVASTHFDYSAENAARHMRPSSLGGLGRLVFQFKKYTQAMIYLLGSNTKKAFQGDKDAAKSLAYLLGFQMAVSGAVGFPLAPLATLISKAIASAWDDDDEPDFYEMAYNGMKDSVGETMARALMKGLPAAGGLDLSGSVGMQQLMNPFAFANTNGKSGADWAAAMMFSLAGPAPALIAKGWDSAKALQDGDVMRAAETATPRALSALLKGYDMANRGITDRRGNTLMSQDEVGTSAAALRALGFQSTAVGDMYDDRNAFYDAKTAATDVRKRLIREYLDASKSGDVSSVREEISGFNERHRENAIKPKDIVAAQRDARNAVREMHNGVRIRKNDRPLARQLGIMENGDGG